MNRLEVDPVLWLVANVGGQLPNGVRVAGKTPADLTGQVPFVRFIRAGGTDDGVALDRATIVAHCFAATLADASMLALQLGTAYRTLRGQALDGAVITRVETLSGPTWTAYGNPNVEQIVRTDRIFIKAA